ncbi:MAG: ribosome silencing factor [Oligoflexia bacterium]|nr:ribosome silencing factor [Oligoflexia bacterium]
MTNEKTTEERVQTSTDPSREKALACAHAAIEKKSENVKILNLTDISGFTDYFIICSGMSDRQVQAIADSVENVMNKAGCDLLSSEGYGEGRWVLMDYGDVVVHIFLDALREYYDLEALWADAPRVKIPSEFYGPAASRLN